MYFCFFHCYSEQCRLKTYGAFGSTIFYAAITLDTYNSNAISSPFPHISFIL